MYRVTAFWVWGNEMYTILYEVVGKVQSIKKPDKLKYAMPG